MRVSDERWDERAGEKKEIFLSATSLVGTHLPHHLYSTTVPILSPPFLLGFQSETSRN